MAREHKHVHAQSGAKLVCTNKHIKLGAHMRREVMAQGS